MRKISLNTMVISMLFCCGVVFSTSPLILNWWIHGNYERYLWIINGPEPYSNLGSGPYQLLLYVGLFTIGVLFFSCRRRNLAASTFTNAITPKTALHRYLLTHTLAHKSSVGYTIGRVLTK